MAITFNESTVPAEPAGEGVARQRLITEARVKGTSILLDRLTFRAGGSLALSVPADGLAWFQVLEGEVTLARPGATERLADCHIAFLPPGFAGTLSASGDARLLYAEVPGAARFDPKLVADPPQFRVVDWTREPLLNSEHDARKRIYLVTPRLFGTTVLKGEMIIYPPGTEAANHHHEGAEHFMYLLQGRATAHANEQPFAVRQGDVVYFHDRERHFFAAEGSEDMRFVEFFVPGEYRTVWAPGAAVCTWLATGKNIRGEKPSREVASHRSSDAEAREV